jgi:[histone H3]-lysine36 N-dimethyltransferase SETMAR
VERRNGQLASVLRDARGIIFIDYLEKDQSIHSEYNISLLERLNDKFKKKRPHLKKKKVLFHAPFHKSIKTTAKLHELGYELFSHPPYSPDLAPSDFFEFADLKRILAGMKFTTNEEAIAETEAYFEAISKSYYKNGIEKLYDGYNSCIAFERNFIEIEFYQKNAF